MILENGHVGAGQEKMMKPGCVTEAIHQLECTRPQWMPGKSLLVGLDQTPRYKEEI